MALKIYSTVISDAYFSQDSLFDAPLTIAFDGITGGVIEQRLYVRNDDVNMIYSGIEIQPIDGGDNIVTNTADGFTWKVIVGDEQPSAAEWELTAAGVAIEISGINDTTTYEPFWNRIEIPRGTAVQSFELVKLQTTASGIAV